MIMSSATPTKKISQRGALGRHHWETHREVTRHG
jgi:hypothetical protein